MAHWWALQTIFTQGRFQILSKSYRPLSCPDRVRLDRFEIYKSFQVDLFPTCSAPRYGEGYIPEDQQLDITSC